MTFVFVFVVFWMVSTGCMQQRLMSIIRSAQPGQVHDTGSNKSPWPRKMWQIFFNPAASTRKYLQTTDPDVLHDTRSWIGLNPGYQYKLMGVGVDSGDDFVIKHFSRYKSIVDTYFALRNPGLKTDLLRYLILWVEGGVYSDLDTWAFKPVDDWVPEHIRASGRRVGAVVGIEWDQLDDEKPWPAFDNGPSDMIGHEVQFCQWTLAGAAGHPIFKSAALTAVERIKALADARQESITDLDPTGHVSQPRDAPRRLPLGSWVTIPDASKYFSTYLHIKLSLFTTLM